MSVQEITDKSVILVLFEAIRDKILLDLTDTIKEVVIYTEQSDNEETQRPFNYPYVSVEIAIEWEAGMAKAPLPPVGGQTSRQRTGLAAISIRVHFDNLKDDTAAFLESEDIKHQVFRAIDFLAQEPYFTPLQKVSESTPIDSGQIQDYLIEFATGVVEGALIIGEYGEIDDFSINDIDSIAP